MLITLLWTSPGKQVPNLGVLNHQLIYLREKEHSTDGKPPIRSSFFKGVDFPGFHVGL